MDTAVYLLLLSLCAWSQCELLADAVQRRSHGYGAYASDYGQDYEPYMFAAVPLHAPFPVVRVLSRVPLGAPSKHHQQHRYSASYQHPVYARPPFHAEYVPANSDYEFVYGEPQHNEDISKYNYEAPFSQTQYQPTAVESEAILYARPNSQGGYVYRKRPGASKSPPKKTSAPIIFRIHKYKIVKDDR